MAEPGRVLVLGRDLGPLERMARVLRHCWVVQTGLVEVGETPALDADVVVLCDSFTEAERQGWVDLVKGQAPGMLIVKMNGYNSGPHAGADATVDEDQGPAALISTVYELLCERGVGSRGWADAEAISWLQ